MTPLICKATHIATGTTTQVITGSGVLHTIVVNTAAAGTITVYDETGSGTTNVIAILAATAVGTHLYDIAFSTGLKIVTAAASDVTVSTYK